MAGMAYGDEGKGATVDFLVRSHHAGLVVRYNGGPQAAHNVVTKSGIHHTFSQFGSGTLAGAKSYLSEYMLVEPLAMKQEALHLLTVGVSNPWETVFVHRDCVVVTPFHRAVNRIKEILRGPDCHGSCGLGVGEARSDALEYPTLALRVGDFARRDDAMDKLRITQLGNWEKVKFLDGAKKLPEYEILADDDAVDWCMRHYDGWNPEVISEFPDLKSSVVFEGAQGVLLDETHGDEPFRTWTDTTFNNALSLLRGRDVNPVKIGCFRTYFTRHGAGPMPTEDHNFYVDEPHNGDKGFQGVFRRGRFDWDLAEKAVSITKPDVIALNHMDVWNPARIVKSISEELGVNVAIVGFGPTADDRHELVNWERAIRAA